MHASGSEQGPLNTVLPGIDRTRSMHERPSSGSINAPLTDPASGATVLAVPSPKAMRGATVDSSVDLIQHDASLGIQAPRTPSPQNTGNPWVKRLVIAGLVIGLCVGMYFGRKYVGAVADGLYNIVQDVGKPLGMLVFIGIFTPWIVFALPTTPIELLSGYCFGFGVGALTNGLGKIIGSALAFALARGACAKMRCKCAGGEGGADDWRIQRAREALATNKVKVAFLLRCAAVPIAVKNYGAAAIQMEWKLFLLSLTIVDGIGTASILSYIGSVSQELVKQLRDGTNTGTSPAMWALIIGGGAVLFISVMILGVWAQRSLFGDPPPSPGAQQQLTIAPAAGMSRDEERGPPDEERPASPAAENTGATAPGADREPAVVFPGNTTQ